MSSPMFDAAVRPARMALDRAGHLLDIAEATGAVQGLLAARLAPDMMNAASQIRTVAGFALRATLPLAGRDLPRVRFADDLRGLRAGLAFGRGEIGALTPADFDGAMGRTIRHKAGEAELEQCAEDYLHLFALPNLWFHLSMVYAIFRSQGVQVGKADFDGLHRYSARGG